EYPAKTIAGHLRMSAELSPESPVQTGIKPAGKQEWDLEIVAYDYFSVFSILCGLMASFGLDIQSGSVYTFAKAGAKPAPRSPWRRPPVRTGTFKRKIVDVFRIGLLPGRRFGPEQQSAFKSELTRLIRLLEEGGSQEAREAVNRRLIESLAGQKAPLRGLDFPVDIRFDNTQSDRWTVLEIHSRDTPAFLYAFSNALAMRGVYIHGVRIKNAAGEAHDWLYVTNRLGNRIETKADQDHLRVAAATIKQFTPFLAAAPDPARAVRYFDQFLDKIMASGRPAAFLNRKKSLEFLARLLGTSDFLWEDFLRIQFDHLLPVLKQTKPTSRTRGKKQFLAALRKTLRTVR
ncbi:MAG TPA: hypothetical protein VLB09_05265, partial [Nitrospiria bacterium]|nr:hypothetical protein [Nitrospiria bacterium]